MAGMMIVGIEVLIVAAALSRFARLPFAAVPPIYACSVVLILYGADFLGVLWYASLVIHGASLALLIALLLKVDLGQLRSMPATRLPRAAVIGAGVAFAAVQIALLCRMDEFWSWDEFSHWGTIIRALHEADTFRFKPNPLYFQDYPPGLALFAYHSLQLTGYSESNAFFSYALLMGCLVSPILGLAVRGTLLGFLVAGTASYAAVATLGPGWSSVLVDHVLAVFFAGVLAAYFLLRDTDDPGRGLLALPVMLAAFALTKQAASSLALLIVVIVIADSLLLRIASARGAGIGGLVPTPREGLWIGSVLAAPVLATWSWKAYVAVAGLTVGWGSYSPLAQYGRALECCQPGRETAVATRFFARLFGVSPGEEAPASLVSIAWSAIGRLEAAELMWADPVKSPGLAMIALALATAVLIPIARPGIERVRLASLAVLMAAGCAGYTFSLLTAYLYAFSEPEARKLASFQRFLNVYVLAWFLVWLMMAFRATQTRSMPVRYVMHAGLAAATGFVFWSQIGKAAPIVTAVQYEAARARLKRDRHLAMREPIRNWTRMIRSGVPAGARIFIAWPNTRGVEFWVTKHELLPLMTNLHCFAFATKARPDFAEICPLSPEELGKMLRDYDYVAIGRSIDAVRTQYPQLIGEVPAGVDRALFRVEKAPGVRLVHLPLPRAPLQPQ